MGQLSILNPQTNYLERATSFNKPSKKPSLLRRTFSVKSLSSVKSKKKSVKFSPVSLAQCYHSPGGCSAAWGPQM